MAVPEQTPYIEHTGNGITKSFVLNFYCESKDYLNVLVDEIEPPIATWSLIGGNVVFTTAPISGSKITIQRNTPFSRTVDYQSYNNSFRPQSVNGDFDRVWWKLQELGVADWILSMRIDALKNYVDRKDDELKAYLMEEIRKQGVALDQLDEYYNYLMQRLAQIAVDKGWDASFVVDGDETQHEINNKIRVGASSNVINFFTDVELKSWLNNPEAFDASDVIIRAQTLSSGAEINFPSGTFKITKKIPSSKSWVGVRGGYHERGTHIIVDNPIAINPVIDCSALSFAVELHDIHFEDKQNRTHTLLKEGVYQGLYTGLRVDKFAIAVETSGTYAYFEDCYFMGNGAGIKPKPTDDIGNANSTMFGCNRCFFIYNDIGYDIVGVSAEDDLINVPFTSCGFELNRIGLNSPNRTWYLTLMNCWFEANTECGIYAPTSHLIEINTRHNENSPKVTDPDNSTVIWGMLATLPEITTKKLAVESFKSNIAFANKYFTDNTVPQNGASISQFLADDAGLSLAKIEFKRSQAAGAAGGSNIVFSTQATSADSAAYERWIIDRYGRLIPAIDNNYNVGSVENRCSSVYTTKVMYTENVGDFVGSGSPEGVVTAHPGSTYRRVDGAKPCFFVKESGTSNTGWVAK